MRGNDEQQDGVFSYVSLEQRVPASHPWRAIRKMVDEALGQLSGRFEQLYAATGRPSIAPEKLLRALLLQALYGKRSERLLMEELDYSLLFRWFVGLAMDDEVWDATVFSKNRDRLIGGEIASQFFLAVQGQLASSGLLSDEHFTVDGTMLEAWASRRSFHAKAEPPGRIPPGETAQSAKGGVAVPNRGGGLQLGAMESAAGGCSVSQAAGSGAVAMKYGTKGARIALKKSLGGFFKTESQCFSAACKGRALT